MREKAPLGGVSDEEGAVLRPGSGSSREAAAVVARAKAVLAVADGATYTQAAQAAGRRSGDAVGRLVARFNQAGLGALVPGHGGGQPGRYTSPESERILAEAPPPPRQGRGGTPTRSLAALQPACGRPPRRP